MMEYIDDGTSSKNIDYWISLSDDELRNLPNMQQKQVYQLLGKAEPERPPEDYLIRKQIFELKGLYTLFEQIKKKELLHKVASVALLALTIAMVAGVIFLLAAAAASGMGTSAILAFTFQFVLFSIVFSEILGKLTNGWKYQNNIDQVPIEEQFAVKYSNKIDLMGLFMFRGVSRYLYMAFGAKKELGAEIDQRTKKLISSLDDFIPFFKKNFEDVNRAIEEERKKEDEQLDKTTDQERRQVQAKLEELLKIQFEMKNVATLISEDSRFLLT